MCSSRRDTYNSRGHRAQPGTMPPAIEFHPYKALFKPFRMLFTTLCLAQPILMTVIPQISGGENEHL